MSRYRPSSSWHVRALAALHGLTIERKFLTSDDLHDAIEAQGIGEPHDPNAYGACINEALSVGLILPTGRYVMSERSPAKHRTVKVFASKYHALPGFEEADPVAAYLSERAGKEQERSVQGSLL